MQSTLSLNHQIQHLLPLLQKLIDAATLSEKKEILEKFLEDQLYSKKLQHPTLIAEEVAFLAILSIGQENIFKEAMPSIFKTLAEIDHFYAPIGGIVGYHVTALKLLNDHGKKKTGKNFSKSPFTDLRGSFLTQQVKLGICELPFLAEIYPLGGLGVRLNVKEKSGEPLPVAALPFCGKTLLEGLIRDIQAREYLYYKLFSKQIVTPIVIMTSVEKRNHFHIEKICKSNNWFGRPQESFFLLPQISVPTITQEGNWGLEELGVLYLQPGGHGALWRMAQEKGVFEWLLEQNKQTLLIRQINNPIAGRDHLLLSFIGVGVEQNKTFGFVSCKRMEEAAEGSLVLVEDEEGNRGISNIEYTEINSYQDKEKFFLANTNILYANLKKILPIISKNPLPELLLNMKSQIPFFDEEGVKKEILGGRLESMMQNIADAILDHKDDPLNTFVVLEERGKAISVTKSSYEEGKSILETPEGAFFDLMKNGILLFHHFCKFDIAPFCNQEEYLKNGPSIIILYHPALGPLFEIIAKKLRGGTLSRGAEIQLEIADLDMEELYLEGSLLIKAKNCMGFENHGRIEYSEKTGKCSLHRVKVYNKGIDRNTTCNYWRNNYQREESLQIVLEGNGEFHAEDVLFLGDLKIVVPAGERWTAFNTHDGSLEFHKEVIEECTWSFAYSFSEEGLNVEKISHVAALTRLS